MTIVGNSSGQVYLGSTGKALGVNGSGGGNYPIVTQLSGWNQEFRPGTVTPSVVLPVPGLETTEEIRYIFTAATTGATFTAPPAFKLADSSGFGGVSGGNSIAYSDLTVGSIYEVSFIVLDSTHIALVRKEWLTV